MAEEQFGNVEITVNDRKAKKEHTCHVCKNKIDIGEVYTLMTQATWGGRYNKYKNFNVCLMHDVANIKIKDNKLYEV